MLELGHVQIGDGDEVGRRAEPARGALGLLQQTVHGLDEGVGSVVDHSPHDGVGAYVFTGYPKLPPRQLGRAMYHVR